MKLGNGLFGYNLLIDRGSGHRNIISIALPPENIILQECLQKFTSQISFSILSCIKTYSYIYSCSNRIFSWK